MSPVTVQVGTTGIIETQGLLNRTLEAVGDLSPPFTVWDARQVGPFFRRQFETSGRFGGSAWRGLAPATVRHRLNKVSNPGGNRGGVDHPLWNTGELKAALQEVGGNSVREILAKRYRRGTTLQRARFHQLGEGVPQREIIPDPLPRFLTGGLEQLLVQHLEGRLN